MRNLPKLLASMDNVSTHARTDLLDFNLERDIRIIIALETIAAEVKTIRKLYEEEMSA